jgi:divalent metal cation (Fe/Co/Zn/Cd) transporter
MNKSKRLFWNKAMLWGLYMSLALILFTSILYITDNFFITLRSWIDTIIIVVSIVLCAMAFKSKLPEDEAFPYSRALGLGIATSFFSSIIIGLFYFILYQYIDPSLIEEIIIEAEEALIETGFGEAMIEQQTRFINPAFLSVQHMFNIVFSGLLVSLITSIFLRIKPQDGFAEAMSEVDDDRD